MKEQKIHNAMDYVRSIYGTTNLCSTVVVKDEQSIFYLMDAYSDQQNAKLREQLKETENSLDGTTYNLKRVVKKCNGLTERVKELEAWKNLTRGLINEIENRQTTADLMHIYAEESGVKEKDIAVYEAGFYDGMTFFRRRLNEELK